MDTTAPQTFSQRLQDVYTTLTRYFRRPELKAPPLGILRAAAQQSTLDPLTGVLNRWAIAEVISAQMASKKPFAVAIVSIDHFKHLNESFGIAMGERILCTFSYIARDMLGMRYVGRWRNGRFLLILPGKSGQEACAIFEKIRVKVEELNDTPLPPFTITLGMADRWEQDQDEQILTRADEALYESKRIGPNRLQSWDTLPQCDMSATAG